MLDLGPALEDLVGSYAELRRIRADAEGLRREARELVIRSRRQRLGLRVVEPPDEA